MTSYALENSVCYKELARVIVLNISSHILNMLGIHIVIELDLLSVMMAWHHHVKESQEVRIFNSSVCRLWNNLGNTYKIIISHSNFRKMVQNNFIKEDPSLEHFKISRTFLFLLLLEV